MDVSTLSQCVYPCFLYFGQQEFIIWGQGENICIYPYMMNIGMKSIPQLSSEDSFIFYDVFHDESGHFRYLNSIKPSPIYKKKSLI